jgi:DNA-binding HxlR family transcriptional regulator
MLPVVSGPPAAVVTLPGVPPGAQYHLTDLGRSLLEPLTAVRAWARQHIDAIERARRTYDNR